MGRKHPIPGCARAPVLIRAQAARNRCLLWASRGIKLWVQKAKKEARKEVGSSQP